MAEKVTKKHEKIRRTQHRSNDRRESRNFEQRQSRITTILSNRESSHTHTHTHTHTKISKVLRERHTTARASLALAALAVQHTRGISALRQKEESPRGGREASGKKVGPEGPGVGMPRQSKKHENQANTPPDPDFTPFDHQTRGMIRRFAHWHTTGEKWYRERERVQGEKNLEQHPY